MTPVSTVVLAATMILLSATPGPVDLVLVAYAVQRGWRAALLMVAGILVADFVFIGVALAGLGYLAQAFTPLFLAFRVLAVALLFWFAWRFFTAKSAATTAAGSAQGAGSFLSGFMLTFGDPKAILFYMSLLPAFLNMQSVGVVDALIVMLCATLAIGLVKTFYIGLAHQARSWLSSESAQRVMHRLAAGMLLGVGVYLLTQLAIEAG